MPFDGQPQKFETEAKPDVFSLDGLIRWLRMQPADQTYCYMSNGHCLLAQYFTDHGFENVTMWASSFWHGPDKCPSTVGQAMAVVMGRATPLPPNFNDIARGDPARAQTFDSALKRALALKAKLSPPATTERG